MGSIERAEPITLQLYSEELQGSASAAQGHGTVQPPRTRIASVYASISIRCRSGIPPFELRRRRGGFPVARRHPAAGSDVSLLGR